MEVELAKARAKESALKQDPLLYYVYTKMEPPPDLDLDVSFFFFFFFFEISCEFGTWINQLLLFSIGLNWLYL